MGHGTTYEAVSVTSEHPLKLLPQLTGGGGLKEVHDFSLPRDGSLREKL